MNNGLPWTLYLVLQFLVVISHPVQNQYNTNIDVGRSQLQQEEASKNNITDEKIISVRITSSVAVGRQKGKPHKSTQDTEYRNKTNNHSSVIHLEEIQTTTTDKHISTSKDSQWELPPDLVGANIEFIKQLYAKKGSKDNHPENVHPFQVHIQNQTRHEDHLFQVMTTIHPLEETEPARDETIANLSDDKSNITDTQIENLLNINKTQVLANSDLNKSDEILIHSSTKLVLDYNSDNEENTDMNRDSSPFIVEDENMTSKSKMQKYHNSNESYDSIAESSIKSFALNNNKENIDHYDDIENVPLARSVSFPRGSQNYINNIRRTTNLERELKSQLTTVSFSIIHDAPKNLGQTNDQYVSPSESFTEVQNKLEHPIVYSEPAKIYSEPAKFYSEPAKIYSEPAKIYSEPAKVYSEPAKIYSEPAKFYSEPASLHLPDVQKAPTPISSISINTTPVVDTPSVITQPTQVTGFHSEKNYEVDEKVSIQTRGRSHGVQDTTTEKCQQDNCKVGYVVEGRQFKKYRVEERTPDGFIVGEYGVVRNEDGALRGVRYTADSDASPRLIYDALMKFLQLR